MSRAHLPIPVSAEQIMVMPAIRHRWTTADVRLLTREDRAWPRYELIAGDLLVTPAPGTAHQIATFEMCSLLNTYLEGEPIGVAFISPSDLELQPGTITQPDVFVVPIENPVIGDALQWSDVKALLVAVEVLSPSSLRTDRVQKRDFYLEAGVEEYWAVDLDARVVERWRPTKETPELNRDRLEWAPRGRTVLIVDLAEYFKRIEKKARMFTRA